jgi:hypothetical protein
MSKVSQAKKEKLYLFFIQLSKFFIDKNRYSPHIEIVSDYVYLNVNDIDLDLIDLLIEFQTERNFHYRTRPEKSGFGFYFRPNSIS